MLKRKHQASPAWFAAGLTSLVLILGVAVALSGRQAGRVPDIGEGGPIGGTYTTLEDAASKVLFDLYRPQDTLASDSSIETVWVSSPQDEPGVQIRYESGITVTLVQWPKGKDPAESYKRQWLESGEMGTLTLINGYPAWVLPGDVGGSVTELPDGTTEGTGVIDPTMNAVELTIGRVDILVRGTASVEDLVRVAESVSG